VSNQASKRIGRNVVVIVAGELIGKGATLAFTVVVARQLGLTAFGHFSYALAFGLLLTTLASWGFDADVIRRGSADRRDLDAAVTEALVLRSIHAVPIILLGGSIGVVSRPNGAAAGALVLVVAATLIDGYGDTGRAAATACEQPGRSAAALVLQRVVACVLAIVALTGGGGLIAVSAAYLLSSIVGQLALIFLVRRMGVRWRRVNREQLIRMWRSTFFIGVDTVFAMGLFRVDALMLEAIDGAKELGSYAVAYRLMETVLFVIWAVSRSLFPSMVRAGSGRALSRVGENALAIAAALVVPVGVILYIDGAGLLHLLFGAQYGTESVISLKLLAFAPLAFALSFYTAYLLLVLGRSKQMLAATFVGFVVNVVLNLLLIPLYGAPGAAAVTTLSYIVEGLVSMIFLLPGSGVFRLDRALLPSAAAALPMAATLAVIHLPVLLEVVAAGLVYLATYIGLARWRDPKQLELLLSLVRRN
jgi:O-antigen/teichoic acid export membrane protein